MTIAESIVKLRQEEGLNNISLAALLGISCASVTMYQNGKRVPPLHRLVHIAVACNRNLSLEVISGKVHAKFTLKTTLREISFDTKLHECEPALRSYCRKFLCRNKDDENDLVQEVFVVALTRHFTLRPEVSMLTWLIGIAKNSVKKHASKLLYVESYIEHDHLTDDIENFFRAHTDVFRYIEKLKPSRKKMYELSLIGMEYKDIARQMNTTEGSIKVMMGHTKRQLRQMIEKDIVCNS